MLGYKNIKTKNHRKAHMNRNREQIIKQTAEAHRRNLQRNVQRRLEVARAKGDENLVRQLEAELNHFN